VAQLITALDPINLRLMAPVYIPFVIVGTVAIERLLALVPATARVRAVPLVGSVLALFLLGQAIAFAYVVRRSEREPVCKTGPSCQSSDLANVVARKVPVGANLYSNNGYLLWTLLGREPIVEAPATGSYRSNVTFTMPASFLADVGCKVSYLAWFISGNNYYFTPEELKKYVNVFVVATASDGLLYRLKPPSPVSAGSTQC
jgi:hypothetical protein